MHECVVLSSQALVKFSPIWCVCAGAWSSCTRGTYMLARYPELWLLGAYPGAFRCFPSIALTFVACLRSTQLRSPLACLPRYLWCQTTDRRVTSVQKSKRRAGTKKYKTRRKEQHLFGHQHMRIIAHVSTALSLAALRVSTFPSAHTEHHHRNLGSRLSPQKRHSNIARYANHTCCLASQLRHILSDDLSLFRLRGRPPSTPHRMHSTVHKEVFLFLLMCAHHVETRPE
jgi:hypothetical protein